MLAAHVAHRVCAVPVDVIPVPERETHVTSSLATQDSTTRRLARSSSLLLKKITNPTKLCESHSTNASSFFEREKESGNQQKTSQLWMGRQSPLTQTCLRATPLAPLDLLPSPAQVAVPTVTCTMPLLHCTPPWHQRRLQPCSAWAKGIVPARALANAHKNPAVSFDHRLPSAAAKTTRRARPPSQKSSGYTRSFLLRAFSRAAPPSDCSAVAVKRKHERGVHGQRSSSPQSQPIRNDL